MWTWLGAREHLPETEVKLEFVCIGAQAAVAPGKSEPPAPKRGAGGTYPCRGSDPPRLRSSLWVPAPDQAFREEQEEGLLGLRVCSERRAAGSLERPVLGPAAPCENCHPAAGHSKPEGDSGPCGLQSVLGQESPVQPEKKVSKWKAHGRREEGQLAGRKSGDPVLSSSHVPSDLLLVHVASRTGWRRASLARMKRRGQPTSS